MSGLEAHEIRCPDALTAAGRDGAGQAAQHGVLRGHPVVVAGLEQGMEIHLEKLRMSMSEVLQYLTVLEYIW